MTKAQAKAEKGLEPVALTPEALNTAATLLEGLMRAPRSVPMQWRTLEEQVLALAVSTLRQIAHPPTAVEPVATVTGYKQIMPALVIGTKLYAHPPTSEWNDALEVAIEVLDEEGLPGKAHVLERLKELMREPR